MARDLLGRSLTADGEHEHWVSQINQELPIYMKVNGPGNEMPVTIYQHLLRNATEVAAKPAFRDIHGSSWVTSTWQDVYSSCLQVVKSLISLDVQSRSCVNIIGANSMEWVLAFLGCICANCVPVGVYATSLPHTCTYIANNSQVQVLFAQSEVDVKKYSEEVVTHLKAVVCSRPTASFEQFRRGKANVYSWEEFMALGKDEAWSERVEQLSPAAVCSIVYTSGTTGPPKGVLLSHDNYISVSLSILSLESYTSEEQVVSYLPLSHTAGQIFDVLMPILGRFLVSFADEKALSGTLFNTIRAVRPTFFFGVPRIYEKIEAEIRSLQRRHPSWQGPFGVQKVKASLGFDRTKVFGIGAAPSQPSLLRFLRDSGISVVSFYGMTESSGPTAATRNSKNRLRTAGLALPGTEMRVVDSNNRPVAVGSRGEVCFRGRNKFLGYLKMPRLTKETIDREGFIHSGDEGYLDDQGFLHITGRFKELIITAGGENVPPVLIEDQIKAQSTLISNVMVVGEGRKYLAALITLRTVPKPDGTASEVLAGEALLEIRAAGSDVTTLAAAVKCSKVRKLVDDAVARANQSAASRAQYIRKWTFLPQDFSISGGELTPTMKLMRGVVLSKYSQTIDLLYTDSRL